MSRWTRNTSTRAFTVKNKSGPGLCYIEFSMVFVKMMSLKRVYGGSDRVSGQCPHDGDLRLMSRLRKARWEYVSIIG